MYKNTVFPLANMEILSLQKDGDGGFGKIPFTCTIAYKKEMKYSYQTF